MPGGFPKHKHDVYCTGRGNHGEDRIAKVVVTERPDLPDVLFFVQVEYIGRHERDYEVRQSHEVRMTDSTAWRTHSFTCALCSRDVPIRSDKLAQLVMSRVGRGKRRVDISLMDKVL